MEGNPLNLELTSVKRIKLLERVFEKLNLDGRPPEGSLAENVEWHPLPEDSDPEVKKGPAAVSDFLHAKTKVYEDLRAVPLDVKPSGDKILVWARLDGKLPEGGAQVSSELGIVYTFEEEQIVKGQEFADRAEAEKAAGLS